MKKLPPIAYVLIFVSLVLTIRSCQFTPVFESIGDRPLFTQGLTPELVQLKKEASEAFEKKDYNLAIQKSDQAHNLHPNDPEPILTSNNARLLQTTPDPEKLITLPVISSATKGHSTAIEVLRGALVAQTAINQQGGINGRKILLKVFFDNNDNELAKKVANKIIDGKFRAVVGHVESNTSVVVAPEYDKAGVVMVSPSSSAMELKGIGPHIFRTIPNSEMMATTLAEYVVNSAQKKRKLGFCYDSNLKAAQSFKDAFIAGVSKLGGAILPVNCDASNQRFSPQYSVQQMKEQGADGLVLYYHLNEDYQLNAAKNLAQAANQNGLPLFGSHSLVATDILSAQGFDQMVVVTPRHPDSPLAARFSKEHRKIFSIKPSWRGMSSYDSVLAIAMGIAQSDVTKESLQKTLHNPTFLVKEGSSGPIKFSISGDRLVTPSLAQVNCKDIPCKFELIPETVTTPNPPIQP